MMGWCAVGESNVSSIRDDDPRLFITQEKVLEDMLAEVRAERDFLREVVRRLAVIPIERENLDA